jgi:hypothetical protein
MSNDSFIANGEFENIRKGVIVAYSVVLSKYVWETETGKSQKYHGAITVARIKARSFPLQSINGRTGLEGYR